MPVTIASTYLVDEGTDKSVSFRVNAVQFGSGYEQRSKDGINNIIETWNINFTDLTVSEATALETIIRNAAGWDYVNWQPPNEGSVKRWIIESYRLSLKRGKINSISCTLKPWFG